MLRPRRSRDVRLLTGSPLTAISLTLDFNLKLLSNTETPPHTHTPREVVLVSIWSSAAYFRDHIQQQRAAVKEWWQRALTPHTGFIYQAGWQRALIGQVRDGKTNLFKDAKHPGMERVTSGTNTCFVLA